MALPVSGRKADLAARVKEALAARGEGEGEDEDEDATATIEAVVEATVEGRAVEEAEATFAEAREGGGVAETVMETRADAAPAETAAPVERRAGVVEGWDEARAPTPGDGRRVFVARRARVARRRRGVRARRRAASSDEDASRRRGDVGRRGGAQGGEGGGKERRATVGELLHTANLLGKLRDIDAMHAQFIGAGAGADARAGSLCTCGGDFPFALPPARRATADCRAVSTEGRSIQSDVGVEFKGVSWS